MILDWREDGYATIAETVAWQASFQKEVDVWHMLDHPNAARFIEVSMRTSDFKITSKTSSRYDPNSHHSRTCYVVVEFQPDGVLK